VDLYVVVDTMGAGRIVGVFDNEPRAREIIGPFGAYYKLYRCRLNQIDPEVLGWTKDPEQLAHMRRLVETKK
jgi:hypothetical protein